MDPNDAYVLRRRDAEEIARLRFQHDVWADPTRRALDSAGFAEGDVVADLGCGPGFLAMDLAERVGPGGRVLALDSSPRFIRHAREMASTAGFAQVEAQIADIREDPREAGVLDGAVCRWTLMFVPEPERVFRRVAAALRPGGSFVALEYGRFRDIALRPVGEAFARTYRAVHRLIAEAGGDADVGDRLASMAERVGLDVVDAFSVVRKGRPGDPVWRWLEGTHGNHPDLVEAGLLRAAELEAYYDEWDRASGNPDALLLAPPLRVVVARRPDAGRPPRP